MEEDRSPRRDWADKSPVSRTPTFVSRDGSTNNPACDQCRLRKVRCGRQGPNCSTCRRAKVACSFSSKGRRVSHTKKSSNNVVSLESRMENIEGNIMRWANAIEQHLNSTSSILSPLDGTESGATSRSRSSSAHRPLNESKDENSKYSITEERVAQIQLGRDSVRDSSNIEGDSTPGSVHSVWAEIFSSTDKLLSSREQFHRSTNSFRSTSSPGQRSSTNLPSLAGAEPSLEFLLQQTREVVHRDHIEPSLQEDIDDGSAIVLPPRSILETFIDPFIKELNPTLPIFSKSSLLDAIETLYTTHPSYKDPVWPASFNHIILQILTAKTGSEVASGQDTSNENLETSFLKNAQRCYTNLEKLLKPRVANLQALLSMAFIALRHFHHSVFEMIFSLVCQIAKTVRLHQQASSSYNHDGPEVERINLFWTIFIVDKQLALTSGRSCHLHSYDCDVPLPSPEVTDDLPMRDQRVAAIGLAFVNEGIYRDLYSAKSTRVSDAQRERKVDTLMQKMDDWVAGHQHLWSDQSTWSPQKRCFGQELQYAMLSSKLMIIRRSQNDVYRAQQKSHARHSLDILKDIFQASNTLASNVCLERMLLHYPPAAFSFTYKAIIEDISSASADDINLLMHVAFCIKNYPTSSHSTHLSKLKAVTSFCSTVCLSIKTFRESSTPILSSSGLSTPNFPTIADPSSYGEGFDNWFLPPTPRESSPFTMPSISSTNVGSTARPPLTRNHSVQGDQYNHSNFVDFSSFWDAPPRDFSGHTGFDFSAMDVPSTPTMAYGAKGEGNWNMDLGIDFGSVYGRAGS